MQPGYSYFISSHNFKNFNFTGEVVIFLSCTPHSALRSVPNQRTFMAYVTLRYQQTLDKEGQQDAWTTLKV